MQQLITLGRSVSGYSLMYNTLLNCEYTTKAGPAIEIDHEAVFQCRCDIGETLIPAPWEIRPEEGQVLIRRN